MQWKGEDLFKDSFHFSSPRPGSLSLFCFVSDMSLQASRLPGQIQATSWLDKFPLEPLS